MMKNKKLAKALIYLIAIIIGALIGIAITVLDFGVVEFFLAGFIGYNISVIIHEGGHLVFGLLSGYGFSSFRIWSFMLMKGEGGIEFKRFKLAGTGGQCLMTPPKGRDEDVPVLLYNLGGVIFNLILSAVCFYFYFTCPNVFILSCTLLLTALLSALTLLTNGIPMYAGGIANDGMNALSLRKDKTAKTAFLNQLRMNEAQIRGLRLSEMPDEWFAIPDGADRQNTAYSSIAVLRVNRSFEGLDTLRSEKEIEELLNSDWNIIGLHRNLLNCDLAFCRLVNYGKSADVTAVSTPEMLAFRKSMKNYTSVIRTEYAMALIHDGNGVEAENKLILFEKVAKTNPYPADIKVERELIALAKSSKENRENEK